MQFPERLTVVDIQNFAAIGTAISRDKNWRVCCHHLDIPFGVREIASEGGVRDSFPNTESLGLGCERGLFTRCQALGVGLCDKEESPTT